MTFVLAEYSVLYVVPLSYDRIDSGYFGTNTIACR